MDKGVRQKGGRRKLLYGRSRRKVTDLIANLDFLDAVSYFIPKLVAATIVGGMVGIERELRNKMVGLKTNILICAGATLYTAVAAILPGDPTRIAAQIVSGIGFLGAGAIFKSQDRVKGLTTAAFIWVIAALGILIGSGGGAVAIVLTAGLVTVVETLSWVEKKILKKSSIILPESPD